MVIAEGEATNNPELLDEGHRMLSSVCTARARIQERREEDGKIGEFQNGALPQEVLRRRKLSAVKTSTSHQLPVVAKGKIPCPNIVLRSGLFAVVSKGGRKGLTRALIASEPGFEVLFTGTQLDQADLDVWLECLRLSTEALGKEVTISAYAFTVAIGRRWGTGALEWLKDSLARLGAATLSVRTVAGEFMVKERIVTFNALGHGNGSLLRFAVPTNMAALFGLSRWTALVIEIRRRLKGKPLAQWLVGFYSTHARPIPVAVDRLRALSGSSTGGPLSKFRQTLTAALNSAVSAGFLSSWKIDDEDRLHVVRVPLPARILDSN